MSIKKQQIIGLSIFVPGFIITSFGIEFGNVIVFFIGLALITIGGLITNPGSIFDIFN
jgi:hypothetical protein